MSDIKEKIFSQDGKEAGTVTLPDSIFSRDLNPIMLNQVLHSMQKNLHAPTSHAKGRGEVRGGGRKPWRQKGTGRARHGSIRSPIWRGGGVTHGPQKTRTYTRKINKKVKDAGLAMALTGKRKDSEIFFVESLNFSVPKTKEIIKTLSLVMGDKYGKGSVLVVVDTADVNLERGMKNVENVSLQHARTLSAYDALSYKYLVLTKPALEVIEERLS